MSNPSISLPREVEDIGDAVYEARSYYYVAMADSSSPEHIIGTMHMIRQHAQQVYALAAKLDATHCKPEVLVAVSNKISEMNKTMLEAEERYRAALYA